MVPHRGNVKWSRWCLTGAMSSGLGGVSQGHCQLGKSSFCLATSMTDGVPRCTSVVHREPPAGEDWGVLLY